jgi:hypothetical protein
MRFWISLFLFYKKKADFISIGVTALPWELKLKTPDQPRYLNGWVATGYFIFTILCVTG